jgi:transcription elongation factor Elf1
LNKEIAENKQKAKKRVTLLFKNEDLMSLINNLTPMEISFLLETGMYYLLSSKSGKIIVQSLCPKVNLNKITEKISVYSEFNEKILLANNNKNKKEENKKEENKEEENKEEENKEEENKEDIIIQKETENSKNNELAGFFEKQAEGFKK